MAPSTPCSKLLRPLLLPIRSLGEGNQLQLATFLDPEDPLLECRLRICSRLRQSRTVTSAQATRIRGAERKTGSLRHTVASTATASNGQLNRQLQALQGPVLGPADLAQRPGRPITLLQEWQLRRRRRLEQRSLRRAATDTEQDCLCQLVGPDDPG